MYPRRALKPECERRLLALSIRGDADALGELLTAYRWRLYLDLHGQLKNVHGDDYTCLADDMADEIILKAIAGFRHYIPREGVPFKLWLRTIANNHVRKWILRGKAERNTVPLLIDTEDAEGNEDVRSRVDGLMAQLWAGEMASDPRTPLPLQTPRSDPTNFKKSKRKISYLRCGGRKPKPQSAETRRAREEFAAAVLSRWNPGCHAMSGAPHPKEASP